MTLKDQVYRKHLERLNIEGSEFFSTEVMFAFVKLYTFD